DRARAPRGRAARRRRARRGRAQPRAAAAGAVGPRARGGRPARDRDLRGRGVRRPGLPPPSPRSAAPPRPTPNPQAPRAPPPPPAERWRVGGRTSPPRLFLGTGKYPSHEIMRAAHEASGTECVTVAVRRVNLDRREASLLDFVDTRRITLLPNTAGC